METESKSFDVVVVGSMFMDFFCYADHLPKPGQTLIGTDFQTGFGGKGANQAVAAQRLGSKTAFIGKIGKDSHGQEYSEHFKKEGVNVEGIGIDENFSTGATSIIVATENGENMIIAVPGATGQVTEEYINQSVCVDLIKKSKVLLCQLEIPLDGCHEALKLGKANGVLTIWNAAPAQLALPPEMFALADILCVNETEAEIITGLENVKSHETAKIGIAKLVADFGSNHVIVTLGSEGAVLWDAVEQCYHSFKVPSFDSPIVDTTGAGDCFLGTLAHCLAQGESLTSATSKAVVNASWSVLKKGTQTSYPYQIVVAEEVSATSK